MKKSSYLLILLLFVSLLGSSSGRAQGSMAQRDKSVFLSKPVSDGTTVIPFQIPDTGTKLPCIRMEVNGKSIWAGVDTGMTLVAMMRETRATALSMKFDPRPKPMTLNRTKVALSLAPDQKFALPEASDTMESAADFHVMPNRLQKTSFAKIKGDDVDCIFNFGALYSLYRIQFDYIDKVIRIFPFEAKIDVSQCVVADIVEYDGSVYITVSNSKGKGYRTRIDTGAQLSSLPVGFDDEAYHRGTDVVTGALGHSQVARKTKTDLVIGGVCFRDVPLTLEKTGKFDATGLGYSFLDGKIITFDIRAKKVYFEQEKIKQEDASQKQASSATP